VAEPPDLAGLPDTPPYGLALLLSEQAARSGSAESDIASTDAVRGGSIDEFE
jgi:hypothetical protein